MADVYPRGSSMGMRQKRGGGFPSQEEVNQVRKETDERVYQQQGPAMVQDAAQAATARVARAATGTDAGELGKKWSDTFK